jgi:plastocyanin
MRKQLVVLLALAALTVAGILAAQAFAATKKVTIKDNFFSTSKVTVKKGGKVTWRWSGTSNPHNVTSSNGHFHSSTKSSGTYSHKFSKKGTFTVICTVHPSQMRMKVVVK